MKDIDFDELDKAVNSLMSSSQQLGSDDVATPVQKPEAVPVSTPAATTLEPTQVTPTVAASPAVQPSPSQPTPAQSQPVEVRSAAPAVKRSGRFMDMVSTPGEQRPARTAPPATPVSSSREGLSITPRNESVSFEPQPESATTQSPDTTASNPVADPITFTNESVPAEPSIVETEQAQVLVNQPQAPLESPFLADAKVEKRPLNAGSSESPLVDLAAALEEDADEATTDTEIQEPAKADDAGANGDDEPPITPQVAELDSDLVAIEATENTGATQATETTTAASEVQAPSVPLGASSISQQYTPQPSSGDQSHAAIYDASQYPEPVAHPAKSKSGWLWVLWVVLLLGIGAGGAIVLYNLGIIP